MSANGKPTIDRIDHGVMPSNDLGRAHRFYSIVYGWRVRSSHQSQIYAVSTARCRRFCFILWPITKAGGVALQDFPISPTPARPLEGVVYGFEVAADNLADVVRAAEESKLKIPWPGELRGSLRRSKSRFLSSIPTATRWSFPCAAIRSATNRREESCRSGASATCAWK